MPFYYSSVDEEELSFALDESLVYIPSRDAILEGYLAIHPDARECVLLADASACNRDAREMRYLAEALQDLGLATLHLDLLTEQEVAEMQATGQPVEQPLLAGRLAAAIRWLRENPQTAELKLGYLGQGAAAAAALAVAGEQPGSLLALMAINGAFDVEQPALSAVETPVLLVVSGAAQSDRELNERVRMQLRGERQLALVAGGGEDLLVDSSALPQVARLARSWFSRYLAR
jgi:putative phosphoribosyl transferase